MNGEKTPATPGEDPKPRQSPSQDAKRGKEFPATLSPPGLIPQENSPMKEFRADFEKKEREETLANRQSEQPNSELKLCNHMEGLEKTKTHVL